VVTISFGPGGEGGGGRGIVCSPPWEVGAAGGLAAMLGNNDSWRCVVL